MKKCPYVLVVLIFISCAGCGDSESNILKDDQVTGTTSGEGDPQTKQTSALSKSEKEFPSETKEAEGVNELVVLDDMPLSVDEFLAVIEKDHPLAIGTKIQVSGLVETIDSEFSPGHRRGNWILLTLFSRETERSAEFYVKDQTQVVGLSFDQEVQLEATVDSNEAQDGNEVSATLEELNWTVFSKGLPVTSLLQPYKVLDRKEEKLQEETIEQLLEDFEMEGEKRAKSLTVKNKDLGKDGQLPPTLFAKITGQSLFESIILRCKISTPLVEQVASFNGVKKLQFSPRVNDEESGSLEDVSLESFVGYVGLRKLTISLTGGLTPELFEEIAKFPTLQELSFLGDFFSSDVTLSEECFEAIGKSRTLRTITFPRGKLWGPFYSSYSDADIRKFGQCKRLQMLRLHSFPITGNCFEDFSECLAFNELSLTHTAVTPAGIEAIINIPNLQELSLSHCPNMNGDVGRTISKLKSLRMLYAHDTSIGKGFFLQCPKHSRIRFLHMKSSEISGEELAKVKGSDWPNLDTAYFAGNTSINDKSLDEFLRNPPPKLQRIDLGETSISDETLKNIASSNLRNLESLRIFGCAITDEGIQALATSPPPRLDDLNLLHIDGISDAGLLKLGEIKTLQQITLPRTASDETIQQLREALPKVRIR